jgi:hypothetical protein
MLDRFNINPTQLAGLLSFTAATISCLVAARRSVFEKRVWNLLAFINSLFALETVIGLRHRVHNIAVSILIAQGHYADRQPLQEMMVISLATLALLLATLFLISQQVTGSATRVAASVTIALLALFAIETVSLHSLDVVFYQQIGSVATIGWLWAIAAAGIILSSISI